MEKAVTRDKVFCMCCGKGFKMLKRHIGAEHGLTEAQYRARFGLPADFPLVAPNYSEMKANYAKKAGLGKYSRQSVDTVD
jgi:predicted transcriptional regulator